jgi:hypothetical protein
LVIRVAQTVGGDAVRGRVVGLERKAAGGVLALELDEPQDPGRSHDVVVELQDGQVEVRRAAVRAEPAAPIAVEERERVVATVELIERGELRGQVDVFAIEEGPDDLQEALQVTELLATLSHLGFGRRRQPGDHGSAQQRALPTRRELAHHTPLVGIRRPQYTLQRSSTGQVTNPN